MVLRGMPFIPLMEEILTMCPKSCANIPEEGREGVQEGRKDEN